MKEQGPVQYFSYKKGLYKRIIERKKSRFFKLRPVHFSFFVFHKARTRASKTLFFTENCKSEGPYKNEKKARTKNGLKKI